MEERTCPVCDEPLGDARKRYCSRRCQAHGVHVAGPTDHQCDRCNAKHFAKGLCRRHYYRARWAAGLDGATSSALILTGMASLYGTVAPKPKPVKCIVTVGLLVDCPWCGVVMAAHSGSGRTCPECSTTVELNPEEVSWVISEAHTTRRSTLTA